MSDEVESMFSYREVPWHGKGVVLDHPATAAEAIVQAGLDWDVELHPTTVAGMQVDDWFATVRTDTHKPLGVVGKRYRVFQNRDLFHFFDEVVSQKQAIYHTGGSLKGGRVVWLLAQLHEEFYVVKDDRVKGFVLLASSHDGSTQVIVKLTPIRVVCNNTLTASLLGAGSSFSAKHTVNAAYEIQKAHIALGLASHKFGQLRDLADTLLHIKVRGGMLARMVNSVFPSRREDKGKPHRYLEPIELLYAESPTVLPEMRGTGWAAFNAITEFVDHQMPTRGQGDTLYRTWFGAGETLRQRAINFLVKQTGDN